MITSSLVKDRRVTNPGNRLRRNLDDPERSSAWSQRRDTRKTRWNGGSDGSTITRRIWTRRDQTWSSKVKERTDDDEGICHGDG